MKSKLRSWHFSCRVNVALQCSFIHTQTTKVTFLFLLLCVVGSAAAGYQVARTFQMDEWIHEWVEEGRRRHCRPLTGGIEAIRVSVGMLCDQEEHQDDRKPWDKYTLGWNWLVLLFGCCRRGGGGWNNTQVPPLLHSYSPAHWLRGSTCKKQGAQWTKFQLLCGSHLRLNFK